MISRIFTVFLVVISIFLSGSAYGADMNDIVPISKDKEKRMGDSISKKVEEEFDEVDDPLIQKRFEEIGNRLAVVSDNQDFIYHFKVLKAKVGEKDKYYNAFCLPGGYIYMFEPLMEVLETDEAIAAVIAHELGHINAKHAVKRLQGSIGVNALMLLVVATAQNGKTMRDVNIAIGQLMTSYSREDEFEADKLSVKYMKKAEFDPEGVIKSLKTLKKIRKKGREFKYMYFKSHPYLSERIAGARSEIKGYKDFDSYINIPEDRGGFY